MSIQLIKNARGQLTESTVFAANQAILIDNYNHAIVCYRSIDLTADLKTLTLHFASYCYQVNKLGLLISCYQVLSEKLIPEDPTFKHKLACFYHIQATIYKNSGDSGQYDNYISRARDTFISALNYHPTRASFYVEYAQFLVKNHDSNDEQQYQEIVRLLSMGIDIRDDSTLTYIQLERDIVCEPIREIIDQKGKIVINPRMLAYYLLIHIYYIHNDIVTASHTLERFSSVLKEEQDVEQGQYLYQHISKRVTVGAFG